MHDARFQNIRFLEPAAARAAVQAGSVLVDVRESFEVEACAYELPAVLHLPYGQLKQRLHELPADKPLLFACKSGKRSLRAAAYLAFKGHPEVANLAGGIDAWRKAELPVSGTGCDD